MRLQPLTPKQAATIRLSRDARIAVWEGAVRSGKTVVSLLAWAEFIATAPEGPLLMAGRTVDTLRRNAIDPLIDLLGTGAVKVVWGSGTATILGRQVHLVGADNASSETRIRGLTLAGAYVDEATIIGGPQGKEWWQMLLTRMSVKGAKVFATTNPGSPSHWLLEDYLNRAELTVTADGRVERLEEEAALGVHRYRFVIDDNRTLDPDYVAGIKASLSGMFYKRFIEGLWVAAEGAVYPMLDLTPGGPHIKRIAPVSLRRMTLGIDHGTTNPTHAVLCGLDEEGVVWVMGEHRQTDPTLTVEQQAKALLEWLPGVLSPDVDASTVTIVADPAAKAFRNEWHAQARRWPRQADNAVLPGISDVATLLGTNRLRFAEGTTPELLRELSGYSWDPRAQQRGLDAPLKKDDHGCDALRYAVRHLAPAWRR